MATARPVVSIYKADEPEQKKGTVPMAHVLACPLRHDLVAFVHKNLSKNSRIAHSVKMKAGYDTAAHSWGTGRAVARIPRAPGGGTHRSGQGAFGNMCRGGGMAHPTRVWRKWTRKVTIKMKRHAVCAALAASALPPLVMAKGHRIEEVPELPLVVSNEAESFKKTKEAVKLMRKLGLGPDMQRVVDSKHIRAGKGKIRGRRYKMCKGPVVVYNKDDGIVRAFRNIPGVDLQSVNCLQILKLAPGGHMGRMIIWTEGAFKRLHEIYGTHTSGAPLKRKYTMLRPQMENADLDRIINSTEIQSVLRPRLLQPKVYKRKINPYKHPAVMKRLNPYVEERKKLFLKFHSEEETKKRADARYVHRKEHKRGKDTYFKKMMRALDMTKKEEPKKEA